jgi:hypothetical protein
MDELRKEGSFYPNSAQRRMVPTMLHKGCGGQVVPGQTWLYKAFKLIPDGTLGCCICLKQPLTDDEIYMDFR